MYLYVNVDVGSCPGDFIVHGLTKQNTSNILILCKGKPGKTLDIGDFEHSRGKKKHTHTQKQ